MNWEIYIRRASDKLSKYIFNKQIIEKYYHSEYLLVFTLAIIIGIITGFAEVGLKELIKYFSGLFFPGEGNNVLSEISNSPWYLVLTLPAIGIVLSKFINELYFKEQKTHGVANVIETIISRRGVMNPIASFIKAFTSAITIGTGGSVGPEGPAVHLGAGIGSGISQLFKVNTTRMRTLVGAGAGAGVAAAFNAPIAGALFAVEIILMEFKFQQFSAIVMATVMATFVSHSLVGDLAEFQAINYQLTSAFDIVLFIILGVASGLVSYLFINFITRIEKFYEKRKFTKSYYSSILSGLAIGLIGIYLPNIMGTGYDTIELSFDNHILWYIGGIIVFVKIFVTGITLSSGGTGGVFAPAIVVGAAMGAFLGYVFNYLMPSIAPVPEAFAIVGIAGLLAGTMHAPFTSIIMVFELTKNQDFVLPTMITSIISVAITKAMIKESIYTLPISEGDLLLKYRNEQNVLNKYAVSDVITKKVTIIYENENFVNIVDKLLTDRNSILAVLDMNNQFYGLIDINLMKDILYDREIVKNVLIAGDIAIKDLPILNGNTSLQIAWETINKVQNDCLPVIDMNDRFCGVIFRKDIDSIYQEELEKENLSSNIAYTIAQHESNKIIHLTNDLFLAEINAPQAFLGKSIKELGIRNNYHIEIISIKKSDNTQIQPNANYIFESEDKIILTSNDSDKITSITD